jgi:hypothetical protein
MYVFLGHFSADTTLIPSFSKIKFNIIFPYMPVSHTLFHLHVIQPQYFLRVSDTFPTMCATCAAVSHSWDDHSTTRNTASAAPQSVIIARSCCLTFPCSPHFPQHAAFSVPPRFSDLYQYSFSRAHSRVSSFEYNVWIPRSEAWEHNSQQPAHQLNDVGTTNRSDSPCRAR